VHPERVCRRWLCETWFWIRRTWQHLQLSPNTNTIHAHATHACPCLSNYCKPRLPFGLKLPIACKTFAYLPILPRSRCGNATRLSLAVAVVTPPDNWERSLAHPHPPYEAPQGLQQNSTQCIHLIILEILHASTAGRTAGTDLSSLRGQSLLTLTQCIHLTILEIPHASTAGLTAGTSLSSLRGQSALTLAQCMHLTILEILHASTAGLTAGTSLSSLRGQSALTL
jgi:hypothetical protein